MRAKLLKCAAHDDEIDFQGIPVVLEWRKGETRTGTNRKGEKWERKMVADYGYVPNTSAKGDQEDLDVYIGPDPDAPTAYFVEQLDDDGEFDERKVVLGCDSLDEARALYLAHYPADWGDHIGSIDELPVSRLREMIETVTE